MKFILSLTLMTLFSATLMAQKFFTRDGQITFTSEAPLERIEAVNNKVASVLDAATGEVEFAVLIKSFHFEKALMEEHFNENYLESHKYPRATFKGSITNMHEVDLTKMGEYTAMVKGDLTIRGISTPIETTGKIKVGNSSMHATTEFQVTVADYNIEIPRVVRDNIARVVQIFVRIDYKPLEQ